MLNHLKDQGEQDEERQRMNIFFKKILGRQGFGQKRNRKIEQSSKDCKKKKTTNRFPQDIEQIATLKDLQKISKSIDRINRQGLDPGLPESIKVVEKSLRNAFHPWIEKLLVQETLARGARVTQKNSLSHTHTLC